MLCTRLAWAEKLKAGVSERARGARRGSSGWVFCFLCIFPVALKFARNRINLLFGFFLLVSATVSYPTKKSPRGRVRFGLFPPAKEKNLGTTIIFFF